jgi:hypothetical protein
VIICKHYYHLRRNALTNKVINVYPENQMQLTTTFEAIRLTSRDTPEAIYIRHPNQPLKCLFLPKAAIVHMSKTTGGHWSIEIPENLAIEKDIL